MKFDFDLSQWFLRCLKMLEYIHTHTDGGQRPTYPIDNVIVFIGAIDHVITAFCHVTYKRDWHKHF